MLVLRALVPTLFAFVACDSTDRAAELRERFHAEQDARNAAAHDALVGCSVAFDAQRIDLGGGLECIRLDAVTFGDIEALLGPPDHVSEAGFIVYPDLGLSFSPDDIQKPLADRVADSMFVREPFVGASVEGVRIGADRSAVRAALGPPEEVLISGTIDTYSRRGVWLSYLADGRLESIHLFAPY